MVCLVASVLLVTAQSKTLTLMLGGDIMLNSILPKERPFSEVASLLRPASCAIANLEIPLTTATNGTLHKSAAELKARNQFILKADPNHASGIAASGIDVVSLGNNHCMDYRAAGLNEMRKTLAKWKVAYAGAGDNQEEALAPTVYTTASGQRIALISALAFISTGALGHCTPAGSSVGVATLNLGGVIDKDAHVRLAALIQAARSRADLVIVGLHWGVERQSVPIPYQVELGRACIDEGADVVWGNHPHVLQGGEIYKGKPILYSMGNLISSKGGGTGLVKLVYDKGQFSCALFLPLEIGGGRVRPVNGKQGQAAAKAYENLCTLLLKKYPSKSSRPLVGPKSQAHQLMR